MGCYPTFGRSGDPVRMRRRTGDGGAATAKTRPMAGFMTPLAG